MEDGGLCHCEHFRIFIYIQSAGDYSGEEWQLIYANVFGLWWSQ
jgi:hypothetical protein